jgi:hypothetical protein
MSVRENIINYEISYIDSDGVSHGTMKHAHSIVEGSDVHKKMDELAGLLLGQAAKMHFESPAGETVRAPAGGIRGIAEALGYSGVPSDEPDGTPG